jgi:acetylornithine/succinyldiaminopimelate/putrescine aminotransferase
MGVVFERGLRDMIARLGIDAEVRGKGLMWGVDLGRDAGAVVPAALACGVVVNRTAGSVIRLLPPYVITEAEIAEGLGLLEAAIADALGGAHG